LSVSCAAHNAGIRIEIIQRVALVQLSSQQSELVSSLVKSLGATTGMMAVVLGGSHARGCALPGSDIDLYLHYSEAAPFSTAAIRELARTLNDTPEPVVTAFYDWGPWVNGGAWLTIGGQRVDFLYRNLEHMDRVIAEAEAGRYELAQQSPFGFFSGAYLGEIAVGIPLFDAEARVQVLKRRVANYPEALRRAVVQDCLWQAEMSLTAFAPKFAHRAGAFGAAASLSRAVHQLLMVLFALNRKYLVDDKTALAEVTGFEHAPAEFAGRVQQTLGHLGNSDEELDTAIVSITQLFQETVALADGLYESRFRLPK
jgi:predicted nucleotidyltransferase